jgi:hypothetical protein
MEPHVSVHKAAKHKSPATAAALPPLDPQGIRSVQYGFFVFQNAEYSVDDHIANSSIFAFHIMSHHFFSKFSKHVAEYGAT